MFALFRRSMSQAAQAVDTTTHKVFIKNISFDSKISSITDAMAAKGLKPVATKFPLHNPNVPDSHKGFGWVDFAQPEEAIKAISELNGMELEGRPVMAKMHEAVERSDRPNNEPSRTIFVGNLPKTVTLDDVRSVFSSMSEQIVSVRLARHPDSQQPKGFAHVEFADQSVAEKAIEEQKGAVMSGQTLRLDYATEKRVRQ